MRYLLRCLNCGYSSEVALVITEKCSHCGELLIINDTEEDEQIAKEMERKDREMKRRFNKEDLGIAKHNIKTYGKKEYWRVMENIKDPYHRIEDRKLFFQALKEIKKED